MRAERTEYVVAGWGAGTLWTNGEGIVLAHEFTFGEDEADVLRAVGGPVALVRAAADRSGGRRAAGGGDGSAHGAVGAAPALRAALRAALRMGALRPPGATLAGDDSRREHGIVPNGAHPEGASDEPTTREAGGASSGGSEIATRVTGFLVGGEDTLGQVALDLGWCTPFQRAVIHVLREVPRGEVVSYGELAALAGHPNAQRAVGTLCARNRFMFLVPCHRVVAAEGIGGYGPAGVGVKRRLLALEGVEL